MIQLFLWNMTLITLETEIIAFTFEQTPCPKINFHKSELFCFGEASEAATEYANLFGCAYGQFSIKHSRITIHCQRLTSAEWKHVEMCLEKRLSS